MKEDYKVLGISETATDEEITAKYNELKNQYSKDRFLEGEAGNIAAKNLTKLEEAYNEIMTERRETVNENGKPIDLKDVEELIKNGSLNEAQTALDNCIERGAEWHYLQSVIFYKKNWTNESKKQLEIAIQMDSSNKKYTEAYAKLRAKTDFNEKQFHSGNYSANANAEGQNTNNRQMGGSGANDCLSFCCTWCLMDMLCNMCCH